MYKKCFSLIICTIFILLFVGCKQGEVNTSIYTQDIIDVLEDKSKLMLNTDVIFPIPSENWFKENKSELKNILNYYFTTNGNMELTQSGMSTMVKTEIKIPFINANKYDKELPLLSYYTYKYKNNKFLGMVLQSKVLQNFKKRINSEFPMATFNLDNFNIKLTMRNTMREKFVMKPSDVYVDDKPIFGKYNDTESVIKPREKVEIRLSKIYIDGMLYYKKTTKFMTF